MENTQDAVIDWINHKKFWQPDREVHVTFEDVEDIIAAGFWCLVFDCGKAGTVRYQLVESSNDPRQRGSAVQRRTGMSYDTLANERFAYCTRETVWAYHRRRT